MTTHPKEDRKECEDVTNEELQTWWSYWAPEHFEADERNTNGGKYRPLPVVESEEEPCQ